MELSASENLIDGGLDSVRQTAFAAALLHLERSELDQADPTLFKPKAKGLVIHSAKPGGTLASFATRSA
jgi:hypothetical protein